MFMIVSKVSVIGVLMPLILMNLILYIMAFELDNEFGFDLFMPVIVFGSIIETGALFGIMWLVEHVQFV